MLNLCSYSLIASNSTVLPGIKSSGRNLLEFLGIILIFIIVLVACWLTTRFVASKQLSGKNTGNFEVMETYAIARDRYLQLVRIGTKYYALAISKDNINTICEVPEEDLVLEKKGDSALTNGFSNVLSNFLKKHDSNDLPEDKDNSIQ